MTLTPTPADIPNRLPAGDYYIGAIVDFANQVVESDETNNSLSSTSSLYIYSDLIVTAVSGTIANGQFISTVTVKNIGNGRANGTVGIFLSTDTTITASDPNVVYMYGCPILAGGASATLPPRLHIFLVCLLGIIL